MNSDQIIQIVDTIISIHESNDKKQEATDAYFEAMHPDSYAPIVHSNTTDAFRILDIIHFDMSDWIQYFIYEVPWLRRGDANYDVRILYKNKEYPLNNLSQLKDFLITEYALDQSRKVV